MEARHSLVYYVYTLGNTLYERSIRVTRHFNKYLTVLLGYLDRKVVCGGSCLYGHMVYY